MLTGSFQNYDKLEKHFNRDHYPCHNPVCIEKKFQVFGSELDLRAHMMEEVSLKDVRS